MGNASHSLRNVQLAVLFKWANNNVIDANPVHLGQATTVDKTIVWDKTENQLSNKDQDHPANASKSTIKLPTVVKTVQTANSRWMGNASHSLRTVQLAVLFKWANNNVINANPVHLGQATTVAKTIVWDKTENQLSNKDQDHPANASKSTIKLPTVVKTVQTANSRWMGNASHSLRTVQLAVLFKWANNNVINANPVHLGQATIDKLTHVMHQLVDLPRVLLANPVVKVQ